MNSQHSPAVAINTILICTPKMISTFLKVASHSIRITFMIPHTENSTGTLFPFHLKRLLWYCWRFHLKPQLFQMSKGTDCPHLCNKFRFCSSTAVFLTFSGSSSSPIKLLHHITNHRNDLNVALSEHAAPMRQFCFFRPTVR